MVYVLQLCYEPANNLSLEAQLINRVRHYGGDLAKAGSGDNYRDLVFEFDRRPLGPELLKDLMVIAGTQLVAAICTAKYNCDEVFCYTA